MDRNRLEQRLREHAEAVQRATEINPIDFREFSEFCEPVRDKAGYKNADSPADSSYLRKEIHRRLRIIIAAALVILAIVVGTFSVSALFGSDFLSQVMNSSGMKSGAETGKWFYHKGNVIVVVVPESPVEIVFVSFRYYMDSGPDIWYSEDRGENWQRLLVRMPKEYSEYRFDAQSPSFDGLKGTYPLAFCHEIDGRDEKGVVNLISDDGGRTWEFEAKEDSAE